MFQQASTSFVLNLNLSFSLNNFLAKNVALVMSSISICLMCMPPVQYSRIDYIYDLKLNKKYIVKKEKR